MIGISNLSKRFEIQFDGPRVISDLSFNVEDHCFFTLLGPSGCGKSTLLRCIAGLERPDEGDIQIGAETVFSFAQNINLPPEKRKLGMVFQSYAIWPHMSVFQNVAFACEVRRLPNIQKRTMEALDLVGLASLANRNAAKLSGGQQQRVAFARAIVAEPRVLLLDEPLSNLDAALREQMCTELRGLHERLRFTTIYVTHDQSEALSLSDKVAVMNGGKFVEVASPEQLWNRPRTVFAAQFLGGANIITGEAEAHASGSAVRTASGLIYSHSAASGPVSLFIRPEHVSLVPRADGVNALNGRVISQRFLGDTRYFELALSGSESVLRCRARTEALPPGHHMTVYIDPNDIEILKEGNA